MKFALQHVCRTLLSNIHSKIERRCHEQGIANEDHPPEDELEQNRFARLRGSFSVPTANA